MHASANPVAAILISATSLRLVDPDDLGGELAPVGQV